jgi:hypothetical protein
MGPFAVAGLTGRLCWVMTTRPWGGEAAGGGAGGLHEGFPVAAGGVEFVAGFAGDEFGGFGGADGFGSVTVCFALGEELQDGGF